MAKYACVRTDNMSGTIMGKDLVSLKYDGDIENGNVLAIGDFVEGEREARVGTAPKKNTALNKVALVATPEVVKVKQYNGLGDFINKNGDLVRGYRLISGDIFSVTKEALDGGAQIKKGAVVELKDNSTKLVAVATPTSETTTVGKIVLVEGDWYVIEVA